MSEYWCFSEVGFRVGDEGDTWFCWKQHLKNTFAEDIDYFYQSGDGITKDNNSLECFGRVLFMEKSSGRAVLKVATQSLNLVLEEKLCFRDLGVLPQQYDYCLQLQWKISWDDKTYRKNCQ